MRTVRTVIKLRISVRGGGLQPPCRKKNSIIRAKLMYRSGKDTLKNILLFNILIYLFFIPHLAQDPKWDKTDLAVSPLLTLKEVCKQDSAE